MAPRPARRSSAKSKPTPKRPASAKAKDVARAKAAEGLRLQTMIAEIVALVAVPAHGVSFELASKIARNVVRDHPAKLVAELVPVILGHLERELVDAA